MHNRPENPAGEFSLSNAFAWILGNKLSTLMILGVTLDWLPRYMSAETALSGTKLFIFPAFLIDLFVNFKEYFRVLYPWLFFAALLIGVGGAYWEGAATAGQFTQLLPSAFILMYFSRRRPYNQYIWILRLTLVLSLSVSVVFVLSSFGILEPIALIERKGFTRLQGGATWSSLGLYMSFIPATLGGLLLSASGRIKRRTFIASGLLMVLGFFAIMLSGQRSSGAVFLACSALSFVLYLRKISVWRLAIAIALLAVIFVSFDSLSNQLGKAMDSFEVRVEKLEVGTNRSRDVALRESMYAYFLKDLSRSPKLVGQDTALFEAVTGDIPHFVIGESYYTGGIFLLGIFLVGFGFMAIRIPILYLRRRDELSLAMLSLLVGFAIQVTIHPGVTVRVLVMIMGLAMSVGRREQRAGQRAPALS